MQMSVVLLLLELLHHLTLMSFGEEQTFGWDPLATPGFSIGCTPCLKKLGALLELLHNPLAPSFKNI